MRRSGERHDDRVIAVRAGAAVRVHEAGRDGAAGPVATVEPGAAERAGAGRMILQAGDLAPAVRTRRPRAARGCRRVAGRIREEAARPVHAVGVSGVAAERSRPARRADVDASRDPGRAGRVLGRRRRGRARRGRVPAARRRRARGELARHDRELRPVLARAPAHLPGRAPETDTSTDLALRRDHLPAVARALRHRGRGPRRTDNRERKRMESARHRPSFTGDSRTGDRRASMKNALATTTASRRRRDGASAAGTASARRPRGRRPSSTPPRRRRRARRRRARRASC